MHSLHSTPSTLPLLSLLATLSLTTPGFSAPFSLEELKGTYVGGYLGGGWGIANVSTDTGPATDNSYLNPLEVTAVNKSGSDRLHPNTVVGGIQANQNWIYQNLLYGVALDYGAFHFTESHDARNVPYPDNVVTYSIQNAVKTNWLLTLRGRLGMKPMNNWPLLYGTAGLAVTDLHVSNDFSDQFSPCFGAGSMKKTKTKEGWTAGGGIELPILKNFTANVEYLYVNFSAINSSSKIVNSNNCFGSPVGAFINPFKTTANFYANLFRVAINYKFL